MNPSPPDTVRVVGLGLVGTALAQRLRHAGFQPLGYDLREEARAAFAARGFQAAGTRGRLLVDGAKTVKIHGEVIPVEARVVRNDQMSAHADRDEILRWLRGFSRPPAQTFLVHGEPDAMGALASTIQQQLGWTVHQPRHRETVVLGSPRA
jgi:metallo-beta-lactamase family protein